MLLKMNGKVNDRRSLINYKLQWSCDCFTLIKLQFSLIPPPFSRLLNYIFFSLSIIKSNITQATGLKVVNIKTIIL